ncbi:trans-aconitate 2-methyltransferase [Cupriavidus sp. AcVe19-6a]|uniref:trans-aconitate 2-methyltransferase n=1 Tax=Cupriavidus sp. AcVe19-6a TaxID=2821358 RepID=UPI001AE31A01|nr:trans-aconitate 2-methyltransferase [Cupriavidus sp. AcVe19-6a]MBP0635195.1 trans-aconitate 2-methyltransferase [Cupriavidus sp. AcVe19-6a]
MSWSARQYVAFEDERTRPVRDLVAAIPNEIVRNAVDIGCGPGNSTEVLLARYAGASITGLDSSDDMVDAARKRLPDVQFRVADIGAWDDPGPYDVILANAVLQWLPDHASLFPKLVSKLSEGGTLAVQMPDNLEEPAHRLMRQVAAESPWAEQLASASKARAERSPAQWYYQLLRPLCRRVDVWLTTYHHPLAGGAAAVVEWFKGSGLRPFLQPLDEAGRVAYLARYESEIAKAYPALPDKSVLLPFPRLFIVATR